MKKEESKLVSCPYCERVFEEEKVLVFNGGAICPFCGFRGVKLFDQKGRPARITSRVHRGGSTRARILKGGDHGRESSDD